MSAAGEAGVGDAVIYIVCDRCGNLTETEELADPPFEYRCEKCNNKAAWAFDRIDKARANARDIHDKYVIRQSA